MSLESVIGKQHTGGEGEGAHWLSVSDLMAGLMMVFLFIAIALMRNAFIERDQIKEVAVAYQDNQVAIYQALLDEFDDDLKKWDANINKDTLAFEFQSPDVLFGEGKTDIRPKFKKILSDFFPRYMAILVKFKGSIDEIRIEGHTSTVWNDHVGKTGAYFYNMELSQKRTRSVMLFVHELPESAGDQKWIKKYFSAVGFSSSKIILNDQGKEDGERSRRVTFRVITNAETQIRKILDKSI